MAKVMPARFEGTCRNCGGVIRKGSSMRWIGTGVVEHESCPLVPEDKPLYSFARAGEAFVVRVRDAEAKNLTGNVVDVQKRNGDSRTVTLGDLLAVTDDATFYAVAAEGAMAEPLLPGVYELPDGSIYIVKPTKDKQRLYAKKLIEIGSTRLNEEDDVIQIDFVYERGAISRIRPEHKMPFDRAKALTIRYGRCIVCGRRLKVAKSVEEGIGPVCRKSFGR